MSVLLLVRIVHLRKLTCVVIALVWTVAMTMAPTMAIVDKAIPHDVCCHSHVGDSDDAYLGRGHLYSGTCAPPHFSTRWS